MANPLLYKTELSQQDIVALLSSENKDKEALFLRSAAIKEEFVGKKVYFRGLVEFSNICRKDCLYCGIRKGNDRVNRYTANDDEILEAVQFAYKNKYASVVLQSGELSGINFTNRVETLLKRIREQTKGNIRVTLSLGEQSEETYQKWYNAGAHRYLLRIETTNPELYKKIHPNNAIHNFETRLNCLKILKKLGYQTGTGVMIGLPFQTKEDLANDLLFFKTFNIDMVGMGPYIEHEDTPLYAYRELLLPLKDRFDLTLKMIAILRILLKDINIAATTAMQAIDKLGREKALKVGANVIMPNITPGQYRDDYLLYQNKPCTDENADDCKTCLEARVHIAGDEIAWDDWGDSKHFKNRTK
jgi:biotin synthase